MDRYRRIEEIGKGAYGKAILVEDKATREKLVVKEMDMIKLPAESQEACREEVKLLARLNHRNVVRYHDSFEERRKLIIVMEYCDGGDLEGKINPKNRFDPRLTEDQIWSYFVQLCLALKYIHGKKVLHRDLKPSNIFLTKKGEVKLGDFGVSRSLKYTMELATTFAGTPVYLSPEVVNSKPYNDKSDVWSLGCILYEMVTGRLPFEVPNLIALCYQIMNAPHTPLSARHNPELRQLVDELLAKNPNNRPSISQILQKASVRRHARRFMNDREMIKDGCQPPSLARLPSVKAEVEGPVSPSVPAMPIDSLELLRAKKLRGEQAAAAAAAGPVYAATDRHDENRGNAAPRVANGGAVPKDPRVRKPTTPPSPDIMRGPAIAVVVPSRPQPPSYFDGFRHFVPLFNVVRRADPEPPKPDRSLKPRIFGMFRRRRSEDLPPKPRSPKSPTPPSPSTQENPPKDKTLYQELLELGDDFDINNLDLTGEKWFKDEIDAQNQANIPNGDFQQEEPPPSYDQLETRLRLSPPPERHHEYEEPSVGSTLTPGDVHPFTPNETIRAGDAVPLKEELLSLDYIKPELDRLPDLKDDEEGPDNFSTLFTLPEPGTEPKQLELYDELLAIELHNRELRLMDTKT